MTSRVDHASQQPTSPPPGIREADQLAAALRGNADAFNGLTEPYRRELQAHCYRILGSLTEAEDMVQETFLHAWKRLTTFQGRSTFRAWLYKIATNACLDALDKRRRRRLLPTDLYPAADPHGSIVPPAAEISWLEPFPDEWMIDQAAANPEAHYSAYEGISLAFLAALQTLPPRQRAVLILSDVLDWTAHETAELLSVSIPAVSSALHRARVTMAATYHGHAPEDRWHLHTDQRTQEMLNRYVQAWQTADVAGLVNLLKQDAVLSMPPSPSWYQGQTAIREFAAATIFAEAGMFTGKAGGRWRLLPTRANGSPAFAVYQRADTNEYRASGLHVVISEAGRLSQITCFIDPSLPIHFGFPALLSG
jgi:RNA polymerase sigma-70 factor (ECF subfamily)